MSLNDRPLLIAPRPVRIAQPSHPIIPARPAYSTDRVKFGDPTSMADLKFSLFSEPPPEPDQFSPRSSPRSPLPSEALEEFLSILRPSCFPPTSPMRKTRRQGAASLPVYAHDRSLSYHGRGFLDIVPPKDDAIEEADPAHSRQPSRNTTHSLTPESVKDADATKCLDDGPFRWFKANILSSPISRNHTRNPFSRQHANASPCAALSPLSPAAIPLPPPTAEEMNEIL